MIGRVGRTTCEVDFIDDDCRLVSMPPGTLVEVVDIAHRDDEHPEDTRYTIVVIKEDGEFDERNLGYDGAWKDLVETLPTEDPLPSVLMISEEYGKEEFSYANLLEARVGMRRLRNHCAKYYKEDGVERSLYLVIASWATEGEDTEHESEEEDDAL